MFRGYFIKKYPPFYGGNIERIKMNFVKNIDRNLNEAIGNIVNEKEQYVNNPISDFTRKRKLSMQDVIKQIISMNGGSLKKELYHWSKEQKISLTASAFVQQRSKISSAAFRDILMRFNDSCKDEKNITAIGYSGLMVLISIVPVILNQNTFFPHLNTLKDSIKFI